MNDVAARGSAVGDSPVPGMAGGARFLGRCGPRLMPCVVPAGRRATPPDGRPSFRRTIDGVTGGVRTAVAQDSSRERES